MGWFTKPKTNIRARDGWARLTSAERRKSRKHSGLSARQQKKVMKANRRYKKGK